jgi:hypothetical protein
MKPAGRMRCSHCTRSSARLVDRPALALHHHASHVLAHAGPCRHAGLRLPLALVRPPARPRACTPRRPDATCTGVQTTEMAQTAAPVLTVSTGLTPAHICIVTGLTPAHICPGTRLHPCPHLHWDPHCCCGIYRYPLRHLHRPTLTLRTPALCHTRRTTHPSSRPQQPLARDFARPRHHIQPCPVR